MTIIKNSSKNTKKRKKQQQQRNYKVNPHNQKRVMGLALADRTRSCGWLEQAGLHHIA